jgi:hypothetical protein
MWAAATSWERFRLRIEAVAASCPGAVFCCESALFLHGVPTFGTPLAVTTVASGGRHGRQPSGMRPAAHHLPAPVPHLRHRHEPAETVTAVVGSEGRLVRTVGVPLAAASTLAKGTLPQALTVADSAAASGPPSVLAVREALAQVRQPGVRGRALKRLEAGRAGAQSPAESGSRAVILGAGFPEPELQHRFEDDGGFVAQVDAWWEHVRLVGEVDGEVKYTDPAMTQGRSPLDVLRAEKRRENRLLAQGIHLRRWGWPEIVHPERLLRLLAGAGLRADPDTALS